MNRAQVYVCVCACMCLCVCVCGLGQGAQTRVVGRGGGGMCVCAPKRGGVEAIGFIPPLDLCPLLSITSPSPNLPAHPRFLHSDSI